MEATLCIHTCLWLSASWIPLASPALDAEGSRGKLTWAVSLEAPEEELEQRAEELARTAGLVNMGRVGELKGHYLFAYQPDGHAATEHEAIRRSVDTLFAQHDSVRWHSEQKLLKRSKRSLHFNDPKYPQQWHLVSGFPAPAVLPGSSCHAGGRAAPFCSLVRRELAESSPCLPRAGCDDGRKQLLQLVVLWGGTGVGRGLWLERTVPSTSWLQQLLLIVSLN